MNANVKKYQTALTRLATEFKFPFSVVAGISLNESGCNPNVKPYFEKTWRYFTDKDGKPLGLTGDTIELQKHAFEIIGQAEYDFQVHAHGAFQTVGSVLRELGYKPLEWTSDFYTQGYFAMKHLDNMRDRFVKKFRHEPSNEQLFAMYNGGFGAVDSDTWKDYVADYVRKGIGNYPQTQESVV